MDELRDIGELPAGWFVLWDPISYTSVLWTKSVQYQYVFPEEWFEMLDWAMREARKTDA